MGKRLREKGIPLRTLNYILIGLALLVAAVLLYVTSQAAESGEALQDATENYIAWQQSALEMQDGSRFLTEQVRCFVVTGERQYLDSYFRETTETRRRGKALDALSEEMAGTSAYTALESAMKQSTELMVQELYAMRLTIAAQGYDPRGYPEVLRRVSLKWEDSILTAEEQRDKAEDLVFGQDYRQTSSSIIKSTDACVEELVKEVGRQQAGASNRLRWLLQMQQALTLVLLLVACAIAVLTVTLVIWPLQRGVLHIRSKQTIPVKGSNEFRFLAETYNFMFEANRKNTDRLTYDATHDAMTGVYNRNGYEFLCRRLDFTQVAILLVDVDKFKTFNDTYGHQIGDRVLERVADVLRMNFRTRDYICRIGGDEFAVIMRNTDQSLKDIICAKVEKINKTLGEGFEEVPRCSVSAGVAFGKEGSDSEDVFRAADAALYEVKKRGGHDCEFAETV